MDTQKLLELSGWGEEKQEAGWERPASPCPEVSAVGLLYEGLPLFSPPASNEPLTSLLTV